jgi:single-strand DNA-binding protein
MKTQRNSVQLTGRLGKDPDVKNFGEGKTRASFSLATSELFINTKGEKIEETQWHNLVLWGDLAEKAKEELKKGNEISVEGKLKYRSYDSKGEKKYITEIAVNEFQKAEREQK